MMERVAIVGIGCTTIEAAKRTQNYPELVYEAVKAALEDAGAGMDAVDNVVNTTNDFWDGRTISCMPVGGVSGGADKNISGVEGDGTFGTFYMMCRILSGNYGTGLVTAHSKGSEGKEVAPLITNSAFDPIHARSLGADMVTACALQARKYMTTYGITEEECALVSVKNLGNALDNPRAQRAMKLTVADVMNSDMIASPLKKLDISPISDGAVCLILSDERNAGRFRPPPVWLKGVGFCCDAYQLGDRNLADCKPLEMAASKAYRMAGIRDPRKEIDVAEVYDAFSYQELLWTEGLGFCERGEGAKLLASGATQREGEIPVNPSGGLLAGHPVIAGGMYRIAEAALQIRGDAGGVQVKDRVKTALAHGVNGLAGQSHCVWILGND